VVAVVFVAAVVTVGASFVEDEVAAGRPLDHGEVLELLSQPVDPEGETLHARVLVHIMMCLDVEGRTNIFKLSEGTLSISTANFVSSTNGSSSASLVVGYFPLSNFF
jgi:hypothetical protein